MPALTFQVDRTHGPLIEVEIKPSLPQQQVLWANAPHVVPSVSAWFLVDTGATHCCIDESLIANWGLSATSAKMLLSVGAPTASSLEYDLALRLHTGDPGWYHGAISVSTAPSDRFRRASFRGLIGMDLLRRGTFSFSGLTNEFMFAW